mmetsp:Transcript_22019/g.50615  ORF Transcript_22019/g.50615 Transcript_22019/m.50615 type:complete len:236 (-) Transcript_22019:1259-1966(-)
MRPCSSDTRAHGEGSGDEPSRSRESSRTPSAQASASCRSEVSTLRACALAAGGSSAVAAAAAWSVSRSIAAVSHNLSEAPAQPSETRPRPEAVAWSAATPSGCARTCATSAPRGIHRAEASGSRPPGGQEMSAPALCQSRLLAPLLAGGLCAVARAFPSRRPRPPFPSAACRKELERERGMPPGEAADPTHSPCPPHPPCPRELAPVAFGVPPLPAALPPLAAPPPAVGLGDGGK